MTALVGQGPHRQVQKILDRLVAIRAGENVPRVLVLEGESGSGKTRIIREVYARLRAEQNTNTAGLGYWPPLPEAPIGAAPDITAMQRVRKRIGPSPRGFQQQPGTLPSFFWWSMNCAEMNNGSLVDVVESLMPQLGIHLPALAQRRRTAGPGHESFKELGKDAAAAAKHKAWELKGELSLESIGQALTALNVPAPGVGIALGQLWKAALAFRDRRIAAEHTRRGGELTIETTGAAEIVRQLSRLGCEQLPIILTIEDLHLMGPGLSRLLDLLGQPIAGCPVLVLGTALPTGRRQRWSRWRTAGLAAGVLEVLPPPPLDVAERVELASGFALGNCEAVAQAYTNPWALILAVAGLQVDGRLPEGQSVADSVPLSIQHFHREQWDELTEPVRAILKVVAAVSQSGSPSVLSYAAAATSRQVWPDPLDLAGRALSDAVEIGWLSDLDGQRELVGFSDHLRLATATGFALDDPHTHSAGDVRQRYASHIAHWLRENTGDHAVFTKPTVRAAASDYLTAGPDLADDPELVKWVASLVAEAQSAVLDTEGAIETWELYVDPATMKWNDRQDLRYLHNVATWVWTSGDQQRAIAMLNQVLKHRDDCFGRRDPDSMAARWDLANWNAAVWQYGRAIRLGEALLVDETAVLGADDPDTLRTRAHLALWQGQAGNFQQGIALCDALLPDLERILGTFHPQTLTTRGTSAAWHAQAGHFQRAIVLLETLLPDITRALGPGHPNTLSSRGNLATAHGQAGHAQFAISLCEALLPDMQLFLGLGHPDTLALRLTSAIWQGQAGHTQQALVALETLVPDVATALGPDHPSTLSSCINLAGLYGEAGHIRQAISTYQAFSADVDRIFGSDHPYALTTRDNMSEWIQASEKLRPTAMAALCGRTPTTSDYLSKALEAQCLWVSVATLIGGCQAHGIDAMTTSVHSAPGWSLRPEAAWLFLVDSGYGPWQVGVWWAYPAAALSAALEAVDDEDSEDLRLILQLNSKTAQEYGTALRLLAGETTDIGDDEQEQTRAALDYIATWVVPGTPTAERAHALLRQEIR